MKLPDAPAPSTEFNPAEGSTIPEEFALKAREDIGNIEKMAETPEEKEALIKEGLTRQYVLIIDRSGSMSWKDKTSTRWTSARKVTEALLPVLFNYDPDKSIPLFLFDSNVTFVGECTEPHQIGQVFDTYGPGSTTNLSGALEEAMSTYAGTKRPNYKVVPGTTFIVLLDGGADDPTAVQKVIQKYADPNNGFVENHTQLAISFIQIADDPGATAFLEELDNNCKPLDIVDTKKDDDCLAGEAGIEKVLRDAVMD